MCVVFGWSCKVRENRRFLSASLVHDLWVWVCVCVFMGGVCDFKKRDEIYEKKGSLFLFYIIIKNKVYVDY